MPGEGRPREDRCAGCERKRALQGAGKGAEAGNGGGRCNGREGVSGIGWEGG